MLDPNVEHAQSNSRRPIRTATLFRQRHFGVFLCILQAHQPQCASTRSWDNRLGKPDASAFRLIKSGAVQLCVLAMGLVLSIPGVGHADIITLAGTGQSARTGDGGPAARASVGGPFGLTIGPDGALYVCETTTHVIRRIDLSTGVISTVAGNGTMGYAGDGSDALAASLNEPYEVRFDRAGNMFFVEMKNHIVRRVDANTNLITTVAGTGKPGFSGDNGLATNAQLSSPHSIALDNNGNLYICDIGNNRIRRVILESKNLSRGMIDTFGGTGARKLTPDGAQLRGTPLNGPRALDFDGKSNLFLALREGNAVYRIALNNKTIHHIGGTGKKGYSGDGGPAKQARLSGPKGIAIATNGDVYLADTESHTIRVIRSATGIIETIVGNGQQGNGPDGDPARCKMDRPHGVFVDSAGNVYIGDSSNHRVRRLNTR
jgi:streptogramin lyase